MKYLTTAIIATTMLASPLAAQKIGVASDNDVIAPAPDNGTLLGGSLSGAGIAAIGALAVIAVVAAAGSGGGGGSSTTTTTGADQ